MGSKDEIVIKLGVSSTINCTPVCLSKERIFLPSFPIILPFTSSDDISTVDVTKELSICLEHFCIATAINS